MWTPSTVARSPRAWLPTALRAMPRGANASSTLLTQTVINSALQCHCALLTRVPKGAKPVARSEGNPTQQNPPFWKSSTYVGRPTQQQLADAARLPLQLIDH